MDTPFDLILDYDLIDLQKLKQEAIENPEYFDSERLENIVERHGRRDRVLTLRNPHGEVVHYSWVRTLHHFIEIRDIGIVIEDIAEGDLVVVFDCWTAPSMRGRGIYSWAIRYLANRAIEAGNTCWIHCMTWNSVSRRGIEKAGFCLYGSYKRIVIFPNHLKRKNLAVSANPLKVISK